MSKCHKCAFCVQDFINSFCVNCKIYGNDTTECCKCNYFVNKKEIDIYNKVDKIIKETIRND